MPTPFPGMDPYLERPDLWPDVHNSLITALRDELAPKVRPRYYVAIEERVYLAEPERLVLAGRPDVSVVGPSEPEDDPTVAVGLASPHAVVVELPLPDRVRESYLEVRAVRTHEVVTVIELLSPKNKRLGSGRAIYEQKRLLLLGTPAHLVEVDLLRAGEPMTMWGDGGQAHYRILVSRSERRPKADLLPFSVRQPIPAFRLPLRAGDEEPLIDPGRLLHELYDRAGYDLRIDYRAEPEPPLEEADAAWADALLRQAGLR